MTISRILHELFQLPDLKIVGSGSGIIEYIEAGGVKFDCNYMPPEEAFVSALIFISRRLAEKEMKLKIEKMVF